MRSYNTDEIYHEWLKIREWEDAPSLLCKRMRISLNRAKSLIKLFSIDTKSLMEEFHPLPKNIPERRYRK